MMHLLIAMLLLQPTEGSLGENRLLLFDRAQGPTPVTDKDLRPMKAPDCRTEAEIQKALVQISVGEAGDCFIRDIKRLTRSRG